MKNCRVVATYFGPRRGHGGENKHSLTGQNAIDMLMDTISLEKDLDNGAGKCDLIIVNHDFGHEKGREFLDFIDGDSIRNGVVRVLHRDFDEGRGESYGSFNYAFENFKDEYDYWFFSEDDYLLVTENYFGDSIKQLDSNETAAFVGSCQYEQSHDNGIIIDTGGYPPHAHGGCGCTHKKYLNECYDKYDSLPYPDMKMTDDMQQAIREARLDAFDSSYAKEWYRNNELNGEVRFTNVYVEMGYKLMVFTGDPIVYDVRGQKMAGF
jgi:hypothetical protein